MLHYANPVTAMNYAYVVLCPVVLTNNRKELPKGFFPILEQSHTSYASVLDIISRPPGWLTITPPLSPCLREANC